MTETIFDHEKLDGYRLLVHDRLIAFAVLDEEANRQGNSRLKQIVSMLTRLIQRTNREPDAAIEYEYREAEYRPNLTISCWAPAHGSYSKTWASAQRLIGQSQDLAWIKRQPTVRTSTDPADEPRAGRRNRVRVRVRVRVPRS